MDSIIIKSIHWFDTNVKFPNIVYMLITILLLSSLSYVRTWIVNDVLFWIVFTPIAILIALFMTLTNFGNIKTSR